jgi:hypothetical protein
MMTKIPSNRCTQNPVAQNTGNGINDSHSDPTMVNVKICGNIFSIWTQITATYVEKIVITRQSFTEYH